MEKKCLVRVGYSQTKALVCLVRETNRNRAQMYQPNRPRHRHHYRRPRRIGAFRDLEEPNYDDDYDVDDQSSGGSKTLQTVYSTVEQLSQQPEGYGPEPGPRDEYSNGPEVRILLSDIVRPGGKRGQGLFDHDKDDDDDEDETGFFELSDDEGTGKSAAVSQFLVDNRDGAFGLGDVNSPEIQHTLAAGKSLPPYAIKTLSRRFKRAQARAMEVEATAAKGLKHLMPSASAARYANDKTRIVRVFDAGTRVRDMERAMGFYRTNADACEELEKSIQTSGASGRRQFGDHAKDVQRRVKISRLAQDRDWSTPEAGGRIKKTSTQTVGSSRRHVGRNMPRNRAFSRNRSSLRGIGPLDIPVFSRASWEIHGEKKGKYDDDDDEDDDNNNGTYYDLGNGQFLAAKLGLQSKKSQAMARDDAAAFFKRRFGLDFNTSATGAKMDPDTGSVAHASLPLVMEAYSVAGNLTAQVRVAEGHLASSDDGNKDHLGNGLRLYAADRNLVEMTSVSEAGWRVRNTSKQAVPLAGARQAGLMLPRGSLLATGFWVLERPQAAPVLLRFQSSGPAAVKTTRAARAAHEPETRRGLTHEVTARWDVYDMAHDAVSRPTKGIGRAVSVIHMTQRRDGSTEQKSRTLLTIHH